MGDHFLGNCLVGATDDVGFNLFEREMIWVDIGFDVLDLIDPGKYFGIELISEELFGDGSSGDAADGFAGGCSPPARN